MQKWTQYVSWQRNVDCYYDTFNPGGVPKFGCGIWGIMIFVWPFLFNGICACVEKGFVREPFQNVFTSFCTHHMQQILQKYQTFCFRRHYRAYASNSGFVGGIKHACIEVSRHQFLLVKFNAIHACDNDLLKRPQAFPHWIFVPLFNCSAASLQVLLSGYWWHISTKPYCLWYQSRTFTASCAERLANTFSKIIRSCLWVNFPKLGVCWYNSMFATMSFSNPNPTVYV